MFDAIFLAFIASFALVTLVSIGNYALRPWPIARLTLLVVGIPISYLASGLMMAGAIGAVQQAASELLSGGICLQGFALPCTDLAGGCTCGAGFWNVELLR